MVCVCERSQYVPFSPSHMDSRSVNGEIHQIDIHRDDRGFGFSIRAGAEYNSPLCVLMIRKGGAADRDSRLRVSMEFCLVKVYCVRLLDY